MDVSTIMLKFMTAWQINLPNWENTVVKQNLLLDRRQDIRCWSNLLLMQL